MEMTRYTWHVLCNDTGPIFDKHEYSKRNLFRGYSTLFEIVSSYFHSKCRQIFFGMKMKGFRKIKLLHKKSEYVIVSFEKCVVKFSSISRANYATTKTDIAYSSVRSNITVERSVEGERKRGKKEKMFFPLFTFPSPLFFSLSFSPFLFSFLCFVNETIKRVVQTDLVSRPISFSSRERKLPVPRTLPFSRD